MQETSPRRVVWDADALDPQARRLAEHAARAAGLPLLAWLERAIRRACPEAPAAEPSPPIEMTAQQSIAHSLATLTAAARRHSAEIVAFPVTPTPAERPAPVIPPPKLLRISESTEEDGRKPESTAHPRRRPTLLWIALALLLTLAAALAYLAGLFDLAPQRAPGHVPLAPPAVEEPGTPAPRLAPAHPPGEVPPAAPGAAPETSPPEPPAAPTVPEPAVPETPATAPPPPAVPDAAPAAEPSPPASAAPTAPAAEPAPAAITAPPPVPPVKPETPATPEKPAEEPPPPSSDPAALAKWLEPRAHAGNAVAKYQLGVLYALGRGVPQDYGRALALMRGAADGDIAEAQYNLALLYDQGLGTPPNSVQAAFWYLRAAGQGHPLAAFNLAIVYAQGRGVLQNMQESARWFRNAAELGVSRAQFNLAVLYERGVGVRGSITEAYAWFDIAAANGDPDAPKEVERLAKALTPAQMKEAKAREAVLAKKVRSVKP